VRNTDEGVQNQEFILGQELRKGALHGLHHPGRLVSVEFQNQDRVHCAKLLDEAIRIFDQSGLRWTRGLQPPGWNCPPALRQACHDVGIEWIMSARDIWTPVTRQATTAMSGLADVSMLFPERIVPNLLHITTNFQATSPAERAFEIVDAGGVLSIKAHISKKLPGHTHLDGVDRVYMNYLDRLFDQIKDLYGEEIVLDDRRTTCGLTLRASVGRDGRARLFRVSRSQSCLTGVELECCRHLCQKPEFHCKPALPERLCATGNIGRSHGSQYADNTSCAPVWNALYREAWEITSTMSCDGTKSVSRVCQGRIRVNSTTIPPLM
jgi:hypothetical protein